MRDLEFRAWDKVEKKMLFDSDPFAIHVSGSNEPLLAGTHRNEDCIFEQYTGLKDKNGQKIYEGDILSVRNKNRKNEDDIGVVEFGKAAFRCPFLLGKYHSGQVEVIGNIHENKELLEAKDVD